MNLGKAFKEIREEAGLSRPEMARRLGITPGALWKIEAGRVRPKEITVGKFCFLRGVPLARFYMLAFEKHDFNCISVAKLLSDKDLEDALRN